MVRRLPRLPERDSDLRRQERRPLIGIFVPVRHIAKPDLKDWKHAEQGHILSENLPVQEWKSIRLRIRKRQRLRLFNLQSDLDQEGPQQLMEVTMDQGVEVVLLLIF